METLTGWLGGDAGLWGVFISSLLGATLLPGGSELVLIGVLQSHPDAMWQALLLATLGNTLGGMVSFGMGWMLPQTQTLKHVQHVKKYGAPALLLAWAPLIGDALCISAGWLRINPWCAAFFMLAGKSSRYLLILLSFNGLPGA